MITTTQPVIIAVGDDRSCIDRYQIKIDDEFIYIDADRTTFEQVFMMYYATFHVFGLNYDLSLNAFMSFFDTYIFKLDRFSKYSNVTGLYNRLSALNQDLIHS